MRHPCLAVFGPQVFTQCKALLGRRGPGLKQQRQLPGNRQGVAIASGDPIVNDVDKLVLAVQELHGAQAHVAPPHHALAHQGGPGGEDGRVIRTERRDVGHRGVGLVDLLKGAAVARLVHGHARHDGWHAVKVWHGAPVDHPDHGAQPRTVVEHLPDVGVHIVRRVTKDAAIEERAQGRWAAHNMDRAITHRPGAVVAVLCLVLRRIDIQTAAYLGRAAAIEVGMVQRRRAQGVQKPGLSLALQAAGHASVVGELAVVHQGTSRAPANSVQKSGMLSEPMPSTFKLLSLTVVAPSSTEYMISLRLVSEK